MKFYLALGTVCVYLTYMSNKQHQFQVGQTYSQSSICDSDCHFRFTVVKRTEKSIWLNDHSGIKKGTYRVKITDYDQNAETCSPLGSYSMAPSLDALTSVA